MHPDQPTYDKHSFMPPARYPDVEEPEQDLWIVRASYFLIIGWWFTGIWLTLAYWIALTVIGLPVAHWMLDRASLVLTLKKVR